MVGMQGKNFRSERIGGTTSIDLKNCLVEILLAKQYTNNISAASLTVGFQFAWGVNGMKAKCDLQAAGHR